MSNISVNTITDASGGSTASINGLTPQASNMQPFNRIINGAMTISQRGFSGTPNNEYTLDRWNYSNAQTGKATISQSSDAPAEFANSLLVTSSSAYSATGTDFFGVQQRIEGYNIADLGFGTASAKTITISFWVKSSLTGTFSGAINNGAWNTSYAFTYSIVAANTWEQKTVTIAGTASGTWLKTNGNGMRVWFSMGLGTTYATTANTWVTGSGSYGTAGSVNVVGTSGATFYITGVQLEAGSTASPFAHENYGDTLQKCQRYYETFSAINAGMITIGSANSGGGGYMVIPMRVLKRATPTFTTTGDPIILTSTGGGAGAGTYSLDIGGINVQRLGAAGWGGLVAGNAFVVYANAGIASFNFDSEL